jgi:hypothetical protein
MADRGRKKVFQSKDEWAVVISLRVPRDLEKQLKEYARIHRQSVTEVVLDGIRMRLETPADPRDIILSNDNTVIRELQEMIRTQVQAEIGKLQDFMGSAMDALKLSSAPEATAPQPTTQPAIPLALEPAPKTAHPVAVPQAAETPGTTAEPVPEPAQDDHTGGQEKGSQPRGRRSGPMRQRILALLAEHPEGLSPEQIRVYLNPEKPIGDVLQGMRRSGVVELRGEGYQKRYFVA